MAYNACILANPASFYDNEMVSAVYTSADIIYFVGAVMYMVTSFRDSGFFNSFGVFARLCPRGKGAPAPLQSQPRPAALELPASAPVKPALALNAPLRTSDNPLQVAAEPAAPAAEGAGVEALARRVAAAHWENGAGNLPPEWDFEAVPGGGHVFISPARVRTSRDPRAPFEAYVAEFVAAAGRGIRLEGYL